ncbi:MAG: hypothetical protein AB7P49_00160 [Bdellovibrionales bacterium]
MTQDRVAQAAVQRGMAAEQIPEEVYKEILLTPDFIETPIPTPDEWGKKEVPKGLTGNKRRYFDIRDTIVDWKKTFDVVEFSQKPIGNEALVFRSGAELGYGRSPMQHKFASALLFWALDASVRTNFPSALDGYGNYFIPIVENFKEIRSTGQSEAATNPKVLKEIMPNVFSEEVGELQAVITKLRKGVDAGSYGSVFRGLPFNEYDYRRSVAIRVQRSQFGSSEIATLAGKTWMENARLYFFICRMFERYRTSAVEHNNFCPAFRHAAVIQQTSTPSPSSPLLQVTIHDYWDGTLDSVIMEVKAESFKLNFQSAKQPEKEDIIRREIEKIKTLCLEMESFAIGALAMGAGMVGKYRVVHGDLKMNNVVVKRVGNTFKLGIIDFGMVTLFENEIPNQSSKIPERRRKFSGYRVSSNMFNPFVDFSYFQYTVRHILFRWVSVMLTVCGTTNQTLVDFCKKLVVYFPCRSVLPLYIYFSDIETYAARPGAGWIFAFGTQTSYDLSVDFSKIGILMRSSDPYQIENTILTDQYKKANPRGFDSATKSLGTDITNRWQEFVRILEKKKRNQLVPQRIE